MIKQDTVIRLADEKQVDTCSSMDTSSSMAYYILNQYSILRLDVNRGFWHILRIEDFQKETGTSRVVVENGLVERNHVITVNGNIRRYVDGSIIVLGVEKGQRFLVFSNTLGIKVMSTEELLPFTMANAKAIRSGNRQYISPIAGKFRELNIGGMKYGSDDRKGTGVVYTGRPGKIKGREETAGVRASSNGCNQGRERSHCENGRNIEADGGLGFRDHVNAFEFSKSIQKSILDNPHGSCLSVHDIGEYERMNCMLFDNGKAGLAVDNGDIVSVFKCTDSSIKGFVKHAIEKGVAAGGNRCDCYSIDGALPAMYTRYGMVPVCKIKFNRAFAPDNWNYERDGEPDIVFMIYKPTERMEIRKSYFEYSDTDVPYIYDNETDCAYDLATRYRDGLIKRQSNTNKQSNNDRKKLSNLKTVKEIADYIWKN